MPVSISGAGTINDLPLPTDSLEPGLVLLHTETFSGVSSVSIDDVFSTTYDAYRCVYNLTVSSNTDLLVRMRLSGTDNTGSTSYYSGMLYSISNSVTGGTGYSAAYGYAGFGDYEAGEISIQSPALAVPTRLINTQSRGGTTHGIAIQSVYHNVSTAYDGITFFPPSGTITGTIRIYGYRNS